MSYYHNSEYTIVIDKQHYNNIVAIVYDNMPQYSDWTPGRSDIHILDTGSVTFKRPVQETDVNEWLKAYNARLGEVHKKYNPYSWTI